MIERTHDHHELIDAEGIDRLWDKILRTLGGDSSPEGRAHFRELILHDGRLRPIETPDGVLYRLQEVRDLLLTIIKDGPETTE